MNSIGSSDKRMISRNEQLSSFLAEHIQAGDFPSAVYLVAQRGEAVFADALGQSVVTPYRIDTQLNTIYDLASLTKPLITGMLCARRIEVPDCQPGALCISLLRVNRNEH